MAMFAISRRLSRKFSKTFNFLQVQPIAKDSNTYDESDLHGVRYKPVGLDTLCQSTKFSRKELQIIYRGFKQECPSGIVNEEAFKEIFAQFFPQGDSSLYAHHIFCTLDEQNRGFITFEDFVSTLSVLARGSFHEKLLWIFRLYDVNDDGFICRDEMHEIVASVYDMMGKYAVPMIDQDAVKTHADTVFKRMNVDGSGYITEVDFLEACLRDVNTTKNMAYFDTLL